MAQDGRRQERRQMAGWGIRTILAAQSAPAPAGWPWRRVLQRRRRVQTSGAEGSLSRAAATVPCLRKQWQEAVPPLRRPSNPQGYLYGYIEMQVCRVFFFVSSWKFPPEGRLVDWCECQHNLRVHSSCLSPRFRLLVYFSSCT